MQHLWLATAIDLGLSSITSRRIIEVEQDQSSACPESQIFFSSSSPQSLETNPIEVLSSDGTTVTIQIKNTFDVIGDNGNIEYFVSVQDIDNPVDETCHTFSNTDTSSSLLPTEPIIAQCLESKPFAIVDILIYGEGLPNLVDPEAEIYQSSVCCKERGTSDPPKMLYTFIVPCIVGCGRSAGIDEEDSTTIHRRAQWMSGQYGIGYRIPAGINIHTATYNAADLATQLQQLPDISYVIINLSNGAAGDRYLAPHPKFQELGMRATSPKVIDIWTYHAGNPESRTINLDKDFDDLDLFDTVLTAMDNIGIKVIAYMNVEGPAKLKHGEVNAFDYSAGGDWNNGGYFVDSVTECIQLMGNSDEACSPAVRKWVHWVATNYTNEDENIFPIGPEYNFEDAYVTDTALNTALRDAYANVAVDYYADLYGDRVSGYWFDAGGFGDRRKIIEAVRRHNPNAAIA